MISKNKETLLPYHELYFNEKYFSFCSPLLQLYNSPQSLFTKMNTFHKMNHYKISQCYSDLFLKKGTVVRRRLLRMHPSDHMTNICSDCYTYYSWLLYTDQ